MRFFFRLGLFLELFISIFAAHAQQKKIVQFYGIVFHEDSLSGAIGAHIYNPSNGRGTSTDYYGYFSLPVAVGDTMHISYQGYKKQQIIIPKVKGDSYSKLIYLVVDVVQLQAVEVTPYMSEQQFKNAVLALNSRSPYLLQATSTSSLPPSSTLNYVYLLQQQQLQWAMRYSPNYLPATDIILKPLIQAIQKKNRQRK